MPSRETPPHNESPNVKDKIAAIPSAALLREYEIVGHELPALVIEAWQAGHRRSFGYAMTALIIGGLLAMSLIGGFVYLVIQGHGGYATTLLGGGALSMVAGFRSVRLNKN